MLELHFVVCVFPAIASSWGIETICNLPIWQFLRFPNLTCQFGPEGGSDDV